MPPDMYRCLPTERVKAFIEHYVASNYGEDEAAWRKFSDDCGVNVRYIYTIRQEYQANVSFDLVDKMLARLDMLHLWRSSPENGGFSDYYLPDVPPAPAELSVKQLRRAFDEKARLTRSVKSGEVAQIDKLHEWALEDDKRRDEGETGDQARARETKNAYDVSYKAEKVEVLCPKCGQGRFIRRDEAWKGSKPCRPCYLARGSATNQQEAAA